jgi:hypothetical protein
MHPDAGADTDTDSNRNCFALDNSNRDAHGYDTSNPDRFADCCRLRADHRNDAGGRCYPRDH